MESILRSDRIHLKGTRTQEMAKTRLLEQSAARKAEEGNFEDAISLFEEAIEQSSQRASLHESLAQCQAETGKYEDARSAASTATALQPMVK
jgi:Flp pilus assembly protein TadD